MTVDFHTHIFPEKMAAATVEKMASVSGLTPYFDGTGAGLLESMEQGGIDCSVILPVVTRPGQFKTVNAFAAQINESCQDVGGKRLLSFGGIHPDSPDYKEELKEIVRLGLKGIKLHPDYQDTMIDDIKYRRIVDYASGLGLITVVHAGIDVGYPDLVHCTVEGVNRLIDEVKPEKFVLAHFGGYGLWDKVEEMLVGKQVYLDTAFLFHAIGEEQFVRMVKKHGSEHVLFGTDCPWSGQRESLDALRSMALLQEEKDNIEYKNAHRLLALKGAER